MCCADPSIDAIVTGMYHLNLTHESTSVRVPLKNQG
jgi:hypothetical protein